jgi:hypothetical protein
VSEKWMALDSSITLPLAHRVIDGALMAGHKKADLRWRFSPAQRSAVYALCISMVAGEGTPMDHVLGAFSGKFCDIPYIVDESLPPDAICLDRVMSTSVLFRLCRLMPPPAYQGNPL